MKRLWALVTKKQMTVGSAALVLATMVLLSRVLGLIRDRLLASFFAPDQLGVYFAAFRIPNFIFELLVMGALTSAFIPVYSRYLAKGDGTEASRLASGLINISLVVFLCIAVPLFLWAEQISLLIAPGFSSDQIAQMAAFTRFMLFFQVAPLLIGNVLTGILQSHKLFLIPALAPVLYNVGVIIGVLSFSHSYGVWAPVFGVAIGACLFVLIQIPALVFIGYKHSLEIRPRHEGIREVGTLMGPRTFGLAVSQIDTTVDLMLSSLLGARMVTIFTFAQQLQQLPIGLFGQTIAQAALPALSELSVKEKKSEFISVIHSAIHQIVFLVLPASMLFIVLRIPVVRLIYGASRFDWAATVATGMTLSAFSISLFAQASAQVLTRAFYALMDSKTPVAIGIFSVLLNTVASMLFILVFHMPVWALGISTSIASIVQVLLLVGFLDRKISGFITTSFLFPIIKMGSAALISGVALYIPLKLFDQLIFDTTHTFGLLFLTGISSVVGLGTYFFLSWVVNVDQVHDVLRLLRKLQKIRDFSLEPAQEAVSSTT